VNCYRIHQKSLNFIYPFKFYSNFTNKNVSWLHFSWATQYMCLGSGLWRNYYEARWGSRLRAPGHRGASSRREYIFL